MQITANMIGSFIGKAPFFCLAAVETATQRAAFYQEITPGVLSMAVINNGRIDADRLVCVGLRAYEYHQNDVVEFISKVLANLPFGKPYGLIARYFEGLYYFRNKNYAGAREIFEELLSSVRGRLKARTSLALAAVMYESNLETSLPYYLKAGALAAADWCDPCTVMQVGMAVGIHKSLHGDHQSAVDTLEELFPISKAISRSHPFPFLTYLNSLAVEYLEVGRLEEAGRILSIVLASPLSKFYPECHETRAELIERRRPATRSVVAVEREVIVNPKVVWLSELPPRQRQDRPPDNSIESGKKILKWKLDVANNKKGKTEDSPDNQEYNQLPTRQKEDRLVREVIASGLDDDELIELMDLYREIKSRRKTRENNEENK